MGLVNAPLERKKEIPSVAFLCCSPLATKQDLPAKVRERHSMSALNTDADEDEDDEDDILAPPASLKAFEEEWGCLQSALKRTGTIYMLAFLRSTFAKQNNFQAKPSRCGWSWQPQRMLLR